jgi:hypothetical protein
METYGFSKTLRRSILLVACACAAVAPLNATTIIFSNLVGNCCGGYAVAGAATAGGAVTLAAAFTPGANYLMTDAQVGVFASAAFGDPFFNISLYSDGGTNPAGLIATLGVDLQATSLGSAVTASGATAPLAAGVQYWVVLSPFDSDSFLGWEFGGSSDFPRTLSPCPRWGRRRPGSLSPYLEAFNSRSTA